MFVAAEAAKLPKLVCVGRVADVLDAKVSESQKYIVQPIQIEALGSGRNYRANFLYRPEQLRPGFNPKSYKAEMEAADAESVITVYRRNILAEDSGKSQPSLLRGLSGSDEVFGTLAHRLLSLPEVTLEGVTEVLRETLVEEGADTVFGYVLKQARTKTNEIGDNGKFIYTLDNKYDLDTTFDYTEKALASWRKSAAKNPDGLKVCYDGEPF